MRKRRDGALSTALYRHLTTVSESRLLDDYLHVSNLYDLCMRQAYLAKKEGTAITRTIDPATRWHFDLGEATEEKLRQRFVEMGIFKESQPEVRDNNLKIQGHPDGRLHNGTLVEVKGMDSSLFVFTKKYPLPKHKFQVECYLMLDKNLNQDTLSAILFSATWNQDRIPWRDIEIERNPKTEEIVKVAVSTLREAEAGGPLPGRICEKEDEKRALLCPVRHACFQLSSPQNMKTIGETLRGRSI